MFELLYFTAYPMLLLIVESLLRSAGLSVPILAFFFAASSFVVSARMSACFGLLFGIAMDFSFGYVMPWDALLFPILTIPAFLLKGKHPGTDVLDFLAGAMIPLLMAAPHFRSILTNPESFAALLLSCAVGAVLLPIMYSLVSRCAARLKIGRAAGNWDGE